jgi:spectinomycin phosphotransferase
VGQPTSAGWQWKHGSLETPPPASIDESQLVSLLASAWTLEAHEIRYIPKGAGSYHWVVGADTGPRWFVAIDDLDTKPWIGPSRSATFEGLGAAYEAARVLEHRVGLGFVVGPCQCADGSVVVRLSDQFSMAVFPYVDGRAGIWGEPITETDCLHLLEMFAQLHGTPVRSELGIGTRPLELPERASLQSTLDSLGSPWRGGPMSELARAALSDHVQDVEGRLEQFDSLAQELNMTEVTQVVTHGEPHPGNLIHSADGLRLIDWDTVALSRPERDLWMLHDASPACLSRYEELTGTRVNDVAIRLFRLAWSLSDISYFAAGFRGPHEETDWTRQKWSVLRRLLEEESSAPYGTP